jgi:hypothetical protein
VDDFIAACAQFPNGAHDGDVDASSQLLVRCQREAAPMKIGTWMCGPTHPVLQGLDWSLSSLDDLTRRAHGRDRFG